MTYFQKAEKWLEEKRVSEHDGYVVKKFCDYLDSQEKPKQNGKGIIRMA